MVRKHHSISEIVYLLLLCAVALFAGLCFLSPTFASNRDFSYFPCPFFDDSPNVGKWGYIDKTGKVVIKPGFERADNFHEGLAAATMPRGKVGYIDLMGHMVIKPQFDDAHDFKDGVALVYVNGKYGYIDRTGRYIVRPLFVRAATEFSEGLAYVERDDEWGGYIDRKGIVVMKWRFEHMPPPGKGWTKTRIADERGYINKSGKMLTEPGFRSAGNFSEGLATIRINNKSGYIDRTGQIKIKPQFEMADAFHESMAAVKQGGKWGYVDKSGAIVVPLRFDQVDAFSEGLASVNPVGLASGCSFDCKWGYIDKTGRMVIESKYIQVGNFSQGLAGVKEQPDTVLYINRAGKTVIRVDAVFGYNGYGGAFTKEGVAKIYSDLAGQIWSGCGFIDRTGAFILEPRFYCGL